MLLVPNSRRHICRPVTHRLRRKLPTAASKSNQPAVWTLCKRNYCTSDLVAEIHIFCTIMYHSILKCSVCFSNRIEINTKTRNICSLIIISLISALMCLLCKVLKDACKARESIRDLASSDQPFSALGRESKLPVTNWNPAWEEKRMRWKFKPFSILSAYDETNQTNIPVDWLCPNRMVEPSLCNIILTLKIITHM